MAGLAVANVLAAQCWFAESRHFGVGQMVKTAAVCQSVGSLSLAQDSQRS